MVRQMPMKFDSGHIILFGGDMTGRKMKAFSKSVQVLNVERRSGVADIKHLPHSIQLLPAMERAENFKEFPIVRLGECAYFYEGRGGPLIPGNVNI